MQKAQRGAGLLQGQLSAKNGHSSPGGDREGQHSFVTSSTTTIANRSEIR